MTLDDIRRLNIREAGSWPLLPKAVVLIFIFVLIVGLGAAFDWRDQLETLDRAQTQEQQLKKSYAEKKAKAVNLELYVQQQREIEQSFGALLKQLPNKSEMDALLIDINQAGLGRGLAFDLFKPAEKENFTEFYAELPVNIKVTGNYHDLGAFASDVAKMPRIVLLTDIKIDPPKDGLLSMEAVAKTYRYLDAEEIAKQRQAAKPKPGAHK
jgi:type IV pilus assembly protein PilO